MTEAEIENKVMQKMDHLDKIYLTSSMSQEEYDQKVREIADWADMEYKSLNTSL